MDGAVGRCSWAGDDALMIEYHDTEWGVPVREDRLHFEYLVLDAFQAGLSWSIILRKREGFRAAFANFDAERIAQFGPHEVDRLCQNKAIVRNRQKINATIANADAFLRVRAEFGSFDRYAWQFVGGATIINGWDSESEIPAKTVESEAMSEALKERGFSFVGPTICYAYMQAAGLVNDHTVACPRHAAVSADLKGQHRSLR